MKLSADGYFISIFSYTTLIIILLSIPPSVANSLPGVTCSINGNDTCIIRKTTNTPVLHTIPGRNWTVKPSNVGFNYYLKTSENGEDLGVKGLLKFKLNMKNWTLAREHPNVEAFLITIIDNESNETIEKYEIDMSTMFRELILHTEIIQVRLQFDDVLKFNNKYAAMIAILPLGGPQHLDRFSINVIERDTKDQKCTSMKSLAERWAPHVMVDVYDPTASLNISWKLAPPFLCIKSYIVIVFDQQEGVINKTEIVTEDGQSMGNVNFIKLPRNKMLTVKVRASNSTDGECACNHCSCLTDKTKTFVIPTLAEQPTGPTMLFNTTSTEKKEKSNFTVFLIIAIFVCFVLATLLSVCFMTQKYNPVLERQILLKTLNRSIIPYKGKKNYKVLLVCPNAVADENQYMERICQGFRNSNNRVVCDKFEQHSLLAEQNMLQWMYRETKAAEKIVVLHSSTHDGGIGVYDILTAFLPANDSRLVHVLLSPKVTMDTPAETKYVLPRDEQILETAFDMIIPFPLVDTSKMPEEKIEPVDCKIENELEIICTEKYTDFDDDQKTHTIDSGVSTMSGNSSDSQELLTNTIDSTLDLDMKKTHNEKLPLLTFPIAV